MYGKRSKGERKGLGGETKVLDYTTTLTPSYIKQILFFHHATGLGEGL